MKIPDNITVEEKVIGTHHSVWFYIKNSEKRTDLKSVRLLEYKKFQCLSTTLRTLIL